jgi:hypothetical protein
MARCPLAGLVLLRRCRKVKKLERAMPVLCPRCHPDQVMKGGKTKVPICNMIKLYNSLESASAYLQIKGNIFILDSQEAL